MQRTRILIKKGKTEKVNWTTEPQTQIYQTNKSFLD